MSRDKSDAVAPPEDALDDAVPDADILEDGIEPMEEDLEAEELGVEDLDDDLADDLDDVEVDETNPVEKVPKPSSEVPAGVRPTDDEDDDDEDEELEADLGEILKERLASEDDDEDDEDDEIGMITGTRSSSKQEDEILCEGCFLLVKPSQYDTRSPEPSCPHCGTPLAY